MQTKDYLETMVNLSYVCAFGDAIQIARWALLVDQLGAFKDDLKRYLIDNY